jgi:hypothetical protein
VATATQLALPRGGGGGGGGGEGVTGALCASALRGH